MQPVRNGSESDLRSDPTRYSGGVGTATPPGSLPRGTLGFRQRPPVGPPDPDGTPRPRRASLRWVTANMSRCSPPAYKSRRRGGFGKIPSTLFDARPASAPQHSRRPRSQRGAVCWAASWSGHNTDHHFCKPRLHLRTGTTFSQPSGIASKEPLGMHALVCRFNVKWSQ